MASILVVEDDRNFNQILCEYLNKNDFHAVGCLNAQAAYDVIDHEKFDLIITDVMMSEINGIEFAETIRTIDKEIPLLFVTARDDIKTKQDGFRVGIDDYMVKPIDLEELVLRIKAILRRVHIDQDDEIVIGGLIMNAKERSVVYDNQNIEMTVREFNILYKMLSYPNQAFSRSKLMAGFWDTNTNSSFRSVDVYITKLRDKLKKVDNISIKTIHGLGYKLVITDER